MPITDATILIESEADEHGNCSFTITWTDTEGRWEPRPSKIDGLPVGHRHGQCFRANPEEYMSRYRREGVPFIVRFADGLRSFRCCCCGSNFHTNRSQDPNRDTGFGTCAPCRAWIKKRDPSDYRNDPKRDVFA